MRGLTLLALSLLFASPALNAGDAYFVGVASSMQKVRPSCDEYGSFPSWGVPQKGVSVRLARNEWESFQICVKPISGDIQRVRVAVDGDLARENTGVFAGEGFVCISSVGRSRGRPRRLPFFASQPRCVLLMLRLQLRFLRVQRSPHFLKAHRPLALRLQCVESLSVWLLVGF